ncbi:hypothetical protein CLM62_06505 [Streptomyces sp. SA15]|uniref:hypothetical protein n=1 Tax=Streptomyces sp. SA15 TaxID=934019 RepID=UPI000BB00A6D|nr:hypothetical protein [Streptomyces sp. SA15]PAZ16595.1 hypothetical protein CLM62_06505 [Streptomyces sp. SA15]
MRPPDRRVYFDLDLSVALGFAFGFGLLRYPSAVWDSSEEGLCCKYYAKCKRYGSGANPLCRSCFVEAVVKWGPGVRQKGYNA